MQIDLGSTVRTIREAKGLKSSFIASTAEISPTLLTLIEQGERPASPAVLERLAAALEVPVAALLFAAKKSTEPKPATDARSRRIVASIAKLNSSMDALRRALDVPHAEQT